MVHARVRSRLVDDYEPITLLTGPSSSIDLRLRTPDLRGESLANAALFGLFQEARILSLGRREATYPGGRIVVARSSVRYAAAIPMRSEPYEVRSVIERLGRASVTMRLQLVAAGAALAEARCVFVGFDSDTKRSRVFNDAERAFMLARVPIIPGEAT